MYLYKVVEVKQKSLMKGFVSSYALQQHINEWAVLGWKLDRIMNTETAAGLGYGRDVFLMIFNKTINYPHGLLISTPNRNPQIPVNEKEFRALCQIKAILPSSPSKLPNENEWKPLIQVAPELISVIEFYESNM